MKLKGLQKAMDEKGWDTAKAAKETGLSQGLLIGYQEGISEGAVLWPDLCRLSETLKVPISRLVA